MKKFRAYLTAVCLLLALCLLPGEAGAAGESVRVTLPGFDVTLNRAAFSNDYSRYPLLVYKDITYFPMTYHDCRLLGLTTSWSAAEGLSIDRSDEAPSVYLREVQDTRNPKNLTARIADGKIRVNGKTIDNNREEYPLLLFRDVTYFPLTWRFAVEEFGWGYHFDTEEGLFVSGPIFGTDEKLVCLNDELYSYSGDQTEWIDSVIHWGTMGGGSRWVDEGMELPISFSSSGDGQGGYISSIMLWNCTGEDINILSDDSLWEYRVYRQIGGRDELVYRQAIPFFTGEFSTKGIARWQIHDSFWETCEKGTYRVELFHPRHLRYESGVGAVHFEPIREFIDPLDPDGAFWLTLSHTVEAEGFQPAGEKYQIKRADVVSGDYSIYEGIGAPNPGQAELTAAELDLLVDTYNWACMRSRRYDPDPRDTVRSFYYWVYLHMADGTTFSLSRRGPGEVRVWGGMDNLDGNFLLHSQVLYDLLGEVRREAV